MHGRTHDRTHNIVTTIPNPNAVSANPNGPSTCEMSFSTRFALEIIPAMSLVPCCLFIGKNRAGRIMSEE